MDKHEAEIRLQVASQAALNGRWGDALTLRHEAAPWYGRVGLAVDDVQDGLLHPMVEYAANCRALKLVPEVAIDLDEYIGNAYRVPDLTLDAHSWMCTPALPDTALLELVSCRLEAEWTVIPDTPTLQQAMTAALRHAVDISNALSRDALSFTRRHIFVESDRLVGRTWVDTGGLTISGSPALSSTSHLAESLFHESLHAKFYVIERGLQNPLPDENDTPEPVLIPWNQDREGNMQRWTAFRAIDAYYVYAHLTIYRLAELLHEGTSQNLDRLRRVCFRAAYLSKQIDSVCNDLLDDERLEISHWLNEWRLPEFDLNAEGAALLDRASAGPMTSVARLD